MRQRVLWAAAGVALAVLSAGSTPGSAGPPAPTDVELTAGGDMSITVSWAATPGAASYHVYRGTRSGGEAGMPIATVTGTTYRDTGLRAEPVYFYQVTAVRGGAESARTAQDASKTPPPVSVPGDVAGVPAGDGTVYYAKDAQLTGFDWFPTLSRWAPVVLRSAGRDVVDMAYATDGTMSFHDVVVPAAGRYTVDWRYAFASGLFPGVRDRQMGISIDGTVVTRDQSFPITGGFDTYRHSIRQVHLHAGVNTVSLFAVSDHGVARVDRLTVTP
jgi:hypothetical protein